MTVDLVERLDAILALDPRAPAIEHDGERYSHGAIRAHVDRLDALLTQERFGPNASVGVLLRNRPACFATALGLILTGRCVVTINPMLPAKPLLRDLNDLDVPVLIACRDDWDNPILIEAAETAGSLGIAISAEGGEFVLDKVRDGRGDAVFRADAPGTAIEMLTSGTTGQPKRIKLALASLAQSLWAGSQYESGSDGPALSKSPALLWMPLVHIGGLWNALYQLYNGRRLILMERFDLDNWHDMVVGNRLRFAQLPPSALGDLLQRDYPKSDFETLLAIRCGAAPLDHDLARQFEKRYGVPVLEAYGATEFAGGVAGWTIRDHQVHSKTKRDSVGRANRGVELRIVDPETFDPLLTDAEGLLEVKSPQVGGGREWIRTTDRARLDEDGFLYILGRADNVINRGGFKIMPDHVEAALKAHPAIGEACVVGIADARLGEVPVAAIAISDGTNTPDYDELKAFLAQQLKPYEIPVAIKMLDELPRTPSLKVSQLMVRELFAAQAA